MTRKTFPLSIAFAPLADDPNIDAHQWIEGVLCDLEWSDAGLIPPWRDWHVPIMEKLSNLPPPLQLRVLKACLRRMRWHREQRATDDGTWFHYDAGSVVYDIACTLYRRKLPYEKDDVIEILNLSEHACGHGEDVKPPFQIARDYGLRHGLDADLFSAMRAYIADLAGSRASQVGFLKREARLLFLLDPECQDAKACWSDRFRIELPRLPAEEQSMWRRLILGMSIHEKEKMSKAWECHAQGFLRDIGPEKSLQRFASWWPSAADGERVPIQTGGSQLLKHFVWLLTLMSNADALRPQCTELVCQLCQLDWKPREPAQKVMMLAGCYLAELPPSDSWAALQQLARWSSSFRGSEKAEKIRALVERYAGQRGLIKGE